jgi:hypothetical protein
MRPTSYNRGETTQPQPCCRKRKLTPAILLGADWQPITVLTDGWGLLGAEGLVQGEAIINRCRFHIAKILLMAREFAIGKRGARRVGCAKVADLLTTNPVIVLCAYVS